jgi:hypothetical protein
MELSGVSLLSSLEGANWVVAANTYGNNHATLIGLLVNWWISLAPETHRAIESGPSYGHFEKGIGGGMCDAVFCEHSTAVGILEVEGTRAKLTIEKVGKFFASRFDDLQTLRFAIVLLYPTTAKRRGPKRAILQDSTIFTTVTNISRKYPDKPIIVVTLDKIYEGQVEGIRTRNDYYKSQLSSVNGVVFERGKEITSRILWQDRT